MDRLPIDDLLPDLVDALRKQERRRRLVLEAPPGAGKTTRVPWEILGLVGPTQQIIVTEPRRIAARLSATRVAGERGLRLGNEVGYRVRFDDCTTPKTRLIYMTEGILLRRLLGDPNLEGVGAIVFDEVHEQGADLELALGLATRLQEKRPDLALVAMSATLEAENLAQFWDGAPRVRSEGRAYPVTISHAEKVDDRPLEIQIRSTLRSVLETKLGSSGDVLVFLPGAREIARATEALSGNDALEIVPLHGDLPVNEQVKAISQTSAKKRIVLSTNVAESSLTIPRVTTVIDSGLARVARHDPWSGVQSLEIEEISQARAIQRSGRAGRTAPGQAYRLFTAGNFRARPAQDTAELLRANLSESLLLLRVSGFTPEAISFLHAPPESAWQKAAEELHLLGALADGELTELGKKLLSYPLPLRLARLLSEAQNLGIGATGARLAALLAERDILRTARSFGSGTKHLESGESDLEDRLSRFEEAEIDRFSGAALRALELDGGTVSRVAQSEKQLRKLVSNDRLEGPAFARAVKRSLLVAFPDRVAERRGTGADLVLANGTTARLSEASVVTRAPFLLAVSADSPKGRGAPAVVRLAVQITADDLMEHLSDGIEAREDYLWVAEKERVDVESVLAYGKVSLDRSRSIARPGLGPAPYLARAALAKGAANFDPEARLETLSVRIRTLLQHLPEKFKDLEESELTALQKLSDDPGALAELALLRAAETTVFLSELQKQDLSQTFFDSLPQSVRTALREHTPTDVSLSGGRRVQIHYEVGRAPWIESRLQDFFSMTRTPNICQGRLPLLLHLLAPNHRAVQVTTDLEGFWERHYPTIRKELMRKYPRHLWPEDARTAAPPPPNRIR